MLQYIIDHNRHYISVSLFLHLQNQLQKKQNKLSELTYFYIFNIADEVCWPLMM